MYTSSEILLGLIKVEQKLGFLVMHSSENIFEIKADGTRKMWDLGMNQCYH